MDNESTQTAAPEGVPLEAVQPEIMEAVSAEEARLEDLVLGIRRNPNNGYSGAEIGEFEERWLVVRAKKLSLLKEIPPPPPKPVTLGSRRDNDSKIQFSEREIVKLQKKIETALDKKSRLSVRADELTIDMENNDRAEGDALANDLNPEPIAKRGREIRADLRTARNGIAGFERSIVKMRNEISAFEYELDELRKDNRRHDWEEAIRKWNQAVGPLAEARFEIARLDSSPAHREVSGDVFFGKNSHLGQGLGLPLTLPTFYLRSEHVQELGGPVDAFHFYRDSPEGRASWRGQAQPPSPFIK